MPVPKRQQGQSRDAHDEAMDAYVDSLETALRDLAWAADTADLLLRPTHPGEAASLKGHVFRARVVLGDVIPRG